MTDQISASRGRGRPSVLDTSAVAESALRLWSERGYASTSWSDLARATGISTRTLLRHFSSRSEIAWLGVQPATARLQDALDNAPRSGEPSVVIRSAIVESVSHEPRVRRVAPDWLRLISSEPELAATAPLAYRPWIETLARYIASRLPDAPAAICRALATAYQAAAFAALIEWADAGADGDCADAVDEMLRWMDIHAPVTIPPEELALHTSQAAQEVSP
ncbi:TetR/AcrR family transcriptional regulator [Nocardia asiatica]|uniref:TetR/AcrR family transcriptional regulator n=1 Tax=Nocardia asiatica TaxID=209252 RepID=UPI0024577BFA|nr:helix-turn-helix domain-containing protein [Nocardia asiatica]